MTIETISEHASFGGKVGFYKHASTVNNCEMRFGVFTPPQASEGPVPALTYLSGLTCTEETFMMKAGAQRSAAELGIMLIAPDTSPRGEDVPDDPEGAYDLGLGAGFYLNATREPWNRHYQMYDYVTRELPRILSASFPLDAHRQGITGHSMGGHGALTIGLRNPHVYRSVSAFAPICSPTNCPWGRKALSNYVGEDSSDWSRYDATELVKSLQVLPRNKILVDQGSADQFLQEQLHPRLLLKACAKRGVELELRMREGYDHGYYFVATFMEDHLRHHASILRS